MPKLDQCHKKIWKNFPTGQVHLELTTIFNVQTLYHQFIITSEMMVCLKIVVLNSYCWQSISQLLSVSLRQAWLVISLNLGKLDVGTSHQNSGIGAKKTILSWNQAIGSFSSDTNRLIVACHLPKSPMRWEITCASLSSIFVSSNHAWKKKNDYFN